MKKLHWTDWIIIAVLIGTVLMAASCNPVKKALRVAEQNPKEFAAFCAEKFPVVDSIIVKDSIHFDTLYVDGEPIINTTVINDTVLKTVYYPGATKFVTKTIIKDSIIIRRDIAKEHELKNSNEKLIFVNASLLKEKDFYKKKFNSNAKQKWITWILLIIGIIIGIYFKKWNLFGFIKKIK